MNGKDCLLSFADIDPSYAAAANDTEAVRLRLLQQKKRRLRLLFAVCGCMLAALTAIGFGNGNRMRQTPAVLENETENSGRPATVTAGSETAPAVSAPPPSSVRPTAPEQLPQASLPSLTTQNNPASASAPSGAAASPAETTEKTDETAFEKAYRYYLNDAAYSDYTAGRVIAAESVGEKIGDATVTAGWEYRDGTMPVTKQLRCEVFQIAGVDPAAAVCIRFLDEGDALTTDHYYVQYNKRFDLSAVSDYILPAHVSDTEE